MPLSLLSEASILLAETNQWTQSEANHVGKRVLGSCSGSAVILAGSKAIAGKAS